MPVLRNAAWAAENPNTPDAASTPALVAGLRALERGDLAQAAAHWQEAVRFYEMARDPRGQSLALTHLAHAYEALGHYRQATESLHTALPLAGAVGDRAQMALILCSLSSLALAAGDTGEAARLVGEALQRAHDLSDARLTATLRFTEGHVLTLRQQAPEALAAYRHSADLAMATQQFGVALRALAHAALAAERQHQPQLAQTLLAEALAQLPHVAASHDTAYDLIAMGRNYHRLAQVDPGLTLRAAAVLTQAADMAQSLQDNQALSYAWGYLARLYEEAKRQPEALDLTRRAVLAAQQVYAPEALYLWQWQTGRLLRALGDLPSSIAAYERAIDTVQSMRMELRRGLQGAPFSLQSPEQRGARSLRQVEVAPKAAPSIREVLGPLYFELADLLLRRAASLETPASESAPAQYAQDLQQARLAIEQFKKAELREYFGDECVAAAQPRVTALEHVSQDVVIVYPILFPDRTEVLLHLPAGLQRVGLAVTGPDLEQRVRMLRTALEARDAFRTLQHAQSLYDVLLRPVEALLTPGQIHTLIFVPDGALRLLPLAALHDGQHYLIEKYAVAVTPSLTLTEPRPLAWNKASLLAAGLVGGSADFDPLPYVAEELKNIQQLYGGTVLLDQDFSTERLDQALVQGTFDIVHIASHGQFAAEAADSFLVTGQGKLTMDRLGQIIGRLRFRQRPIELLTLSACETASGDDRAALGLAGVAIQAGARSALATLWKVADDATALLMTTFYQRLKVPGTSRARALQEAQRSLLGDARFTEPFFWAPFLLINNWL